MIIRPDLIMNYHCYEAKQPGSTIFDYTYRLIELPWSSKRRMWMLFAMTMLCLTCSGVIFGHSAMRSLMRVNKIYHGYCTAEEIRNHTTICVGEEIRFVITFVLAAVLSHCSLLPALLCVNYLGAHVAGAFGSAVSFTGLTMISISWIMSWKLYIPAYQLVSVGGAFIYTAAMHYCRLFPKRPHSAQLLLTTAFELSSGVFGLFTRSHYLRDASVPFPAYFILLSMCPLAGIFVFLMLMPKIDIPTIKFTTSKWHIKPIHADRSLLSQMGTWEFINGTIFMAIYMLRTNFFIATVGMQTYYLMSAPDAYIFAQYPGGVYGVFTHMFDTMLSVGVLIMLSIVCIMHNDFRISVSYAVIAIYMFIWGFMQNAHWVSWQVFGVLGFSVVRPTIYSTFIEFFERVFGYQHFSYTTVVSTFIAGLFSLLAIPLAYVSMTTFQLSFYYANSALQIACVACAYFPIILAWRGM